jgi:threonine aldolase
MKSLASDNTSGIHPEILAAITAANFEHQGAYGNDEYTQKAIQLFKKHFGQHTEVFFTFNGTGANVLSLAAATQSYGAVICANTSHINVDESTAPEKFTGCRLVSIDTPNGKLTTSQIAEKIKGLGVEHHPQPQVISITQSTEYGTVYSVEEIKAISALAKQHGLYLHIDGARISNAAVSLQKDFAAFTTEAGVDIVSFGGTKNGLLCGEAIVFLNPALAKNFKYIRKQGMQLFSKMRFIAAQFIAFLEADLWYRNAEHANTMAQKLAATLRQYPQIQLTQEVQANGVFAILPPTWIPLLQEEIYFYVWNDTLSEVRFVCSFDTTDEDIAKIAQKLAKLAETTNFGSGRRPCR